MIISFKAHKSLDDQKAIEFLNTSYKEYLEHETYKKSKIDWIGDHFFNLNTDDRGEGSALSFISKKIIDVCESITNKKTYEYIEESEDNYIWFLTIINLPFFSDKLNYGTSCRGSWWDCAKINPCDIDYNGERVNSIEFNSDTWLIFIKAMILFSKE
jgi:hypothetical protein